MADTRLAEAIDHHRQGRLQRASALYASLVADQPRHADALHLLGVVALQQGDAPRAVGLIEEAVGVRPGTADFHANLGEAYRRLGDAAPALANLRQAVSLDPGHADAHNNLGLALRDAGDGAAAEEHFRRAMALAPAAPRAYCNLGALPRAGDRLEAAEAVLRRALAIAPGFADAHANLGNVLLQAGRGAAAKAAYAAALEHDPSHAEAMVGMATALKEAGEAAASTEFYRRAVLARPDFAKAHYNLAINLAETGDLEHARQGYRRAVALAPDMVAAHANLARLDLLDGRFGDGFDRWEWRWREPDTWMRRLDAPSWDGTPLAGRTLLVWAEQGVGDEIMLASLLGEVIAAAAKVVVECDARLVPLLARAFPGAEFVARAEPAHPRLIAGDIDVQCALGSLCRWLRRDAAAFPAPRAFLRADPARLAAARACLAALGPGRKVGIAWRSVARGPGRENRRFSAGKSTELAAWAPILGIEGLCFVNLQYGDCGGDLAAVESRLGVRIHADPAVDQMASLEDFAAQVAALDLVVSVSNTTVHMAGALGAQVWTMLPFFADWRWQTGRADTLWYPAVRLYRQPAADDWESVIGRVAADLRALPLLE